MEIERLPPDEEKESDDDKTIQININLDGDNEESPYLKKPYKQDLDMHSAWDDLGMIQSSPEEDISPWGELVKIVYGKELFDDPDFSGE